jgi:HAD superfamily hydrolase (TIGR01509 family)
MNIKGAIFDMDGTLTDSMSVYEYIYSDFLLKHGAVPAATLREDVRKRDAHQISEFLRLTYLPAFTEREIFEGINHLLEPYYFNEALLKPGALPLLSLLREREIPMVIATATERLLVEGALKNNGVFEYFARIFTCAEENTGKEKPDIFLSAAAFLGTAPGDTVVFEDALYALSSAKNAGFTVVGIADFSNKAVRGELAAAADYFWHSLDEGLALI